MVPEVYVLSDSYLYFGTLDYFHFMPKLSSGSFNNDNAACNAYDTLYSPGIRKQFTHNITNYKCNWACEGALMYSHLTRGPWSTEIPAPTVEFLLPWNWDTYG